MEKDKNIRSIIGSIAGDIIGSVYEFRGVPADNNIKIFGEGYAYTDDTVLTVAIAHWILCRTQLTPFDTLLNYGRAYHWIGYGPSFVRWLQQVNPQPYNSCGNGSAMRSSAVGWYAKDVEEVLLLAKESAMPTHNHPEGVKGAQALALAVFYARQHCTKDVIRHELTSRFGYDLNRTSEEILCEGYDFHVLCHNTVPEAVIAFLESDSFEDAVTRAMKTNKDCDTAACIAGAIAGAFYGVPEYIYKKSLDALDNNLKDVVRVFDDRIVKGL